LNQISSKFFPSKSVLVIDDVDAIRNAVKSMLQMLGCRNIAVAGTGNRALELCKKKKYDIILCDFHLGKGKDGYQLFEELKLRSLLKNNTIFIMISAETALQVVYGLVELQPDDYLLKPFSYKKVENSLKRAVNKRLALGNIYEALAIKDYKKALFECSAAMVESKRYKMPIMRLKGEILLNLHKPDLALNLYNSVLSERSLSWAKLGKAVTYYHLDNYDESIRLLNELVKLKETRIESLNWLANIYVQKGAYSEAKERLLQAVKLSPKNISRQQTLANISLLQGDWENGLRALKSVLTNTRFSVHEHIDHHFNYIHSLLDSAKEGGELKQAKVFLQVQSVLKDALLRFDKSLYQELEKVAVARMMTGKGHLKQSVELLNSCDVEMLRNNSRDSLLNLANSWFEAGNHDKYDQLVDSIALPEQTENITEVSKMLLIQKVKQSNRVESEELLRLNEQGIQLYRNGLYAAATTVFLEAFEVVPNNVQLSLNLAQSLLKGWPSAEGFDKKRSVVKQCINVVESEVLSDTSKKRYAAIEYELKSIC